MMGSLFGFSRPPSEAEAMQRAIFAFENQIDAQRIGGSFMIAVTAAANNAELAAQIANATVDAYINNKLQAQFETTQRASVWLQDRMRELADQSAAADRAVADFKAKHNVVSAGTGSL